jgi:hypothetical protein
MNSVISAYAKTLKREPRFATRDREPRELWNIVQPTHQDLHNRWVGLSFAQSRKRFMAVPRSKKENIPLRDILNEAQPGNLDQRGGDVDRQVVQDFLMTKTSQTVGPIQPLSAVSNPIIPEPWTPAIVGSLWQDTGNVIGLKCETIQMPPGTGRRAEGHVMLYDSARFEAVSEPISFVLEDGRVRFRPDAPEVFFRLPVVDAAVAIACIVYRIEGETRLPSAVGFQSIFVSHPERRTVSPITGITSFQPVWANASQSMMSEMIKTVQGNASVIYKLDSKISVTVYDKPNVHPWFYSWMAPTGDAKFLALPINGGIHSLAPVGFISDIRIGLGKQIKSPTLQLIVHVIPDIPSSWTSQLDEQPVLITDAGHLEARYASCALSVSEEMEFPDVIRIAVNERSTRETALAVFFLRIRADKKDKENPIFKVGIVPLDLDSIPENGVLHVSLYDLKGVPKDFLKQTAKPNKKTYLQCRVTLPPMYFVPKCFQKHTGAIFVPEASSSQLMGQMIPFVARALQNLTEDLFILVLDYLSRIEDSEKLKVLASWVSNIFNPSQLLKSGFIDAWLPMIVKVGNALVHGSARQKPDPQKKESKKDKHGKAEEAKLLEQIERDETLLSSLLDALPTFFDIVFIAWLDNPSQGNPRLLITNLRAVGSFVCSTIKRAGIERAMLACVHLSRFIYAILPYYDFKEIEPAITSVLYGIDQLRRAQIVDGVGLSRIAFRFLQPMAHSRHFIVGVSGRVTPLQARKAVSPYTPLLSMLFLTSLHTFACGHKGAIGLGTGFFSRLAAEIEQIPQPVIAEVVQTLFPLCDIISQNFGSPAFRQTRSLQLGLIPFTMLLLNNSSADFVVNYFRTSAGSFPGQFIGFLDLAAVALVQEINETGRDKKPVIAYLDQLTRRILQFLLVIVRELREAMPDVVSLLGSLLCQYQSPDNYDHFFNFITQCLATYECQSSLITLLLGRVTSRIHRTRCFATALLIRQFSTDFTHNKTIILSSIAFLDSLTQSLLDVDRKSIGNYLNVIEQIRVLTSQGVELPGLDFKAAVEDRMNAAKVIFEVVKTQRESKMLPEERCGQCMRIADQYFSTPKMRQKWLEEILKLNSENQDIISAFVTQLHIIALIDTVVDHNRQQKLSYTRQQSDKTPPYHLCIVQPVHWAYPEFKYPVAQSVLDFSFMNELLVETQIPFEKMQITEQKMLEAFTPDMLIEACKKGIDLGKQANAFYSIRPLLSLRLRLAYLTRNFAEAAKICQELDSTFGNIKSAGLTHDSPYAFFLVEMRDKSKKDPVRRAMYCFPKSTNAPEEFCRTCGTDERFGSLPRKVCRVHDSCEGDGVCIVPMEPLHDEPKDGEDPHCWNEFRIQVSLPDWMDQRKGQPVLRLCRLKTKDFMPHYRILATLESYALEEVSIVNIVQEAARQSAKALDRVAGEFDIWFEMEENLTTSASATSQLFGKEMPKFTKVLDQTLVPRDSINQWLARLKNIDLSSARRIAQEMMPSFEKLMRVFRRACKELPEMQSYTEGLSMYESLLKKFSNDYQTEPLTGLMIESRPNLMAQKFPFES